MENERKILQRHLDSYVPTRRRPAKLIEHFVRGLTKDTFKGKNIHSESLSGWSYGQMLPVDTYYARAIVKGNQLIAQTSFLISASFKAKLTLAWPNLIFDENV